MKAKQTSLALADAANPEIGAAMGVPKRRKSPAKSPRTIRAKRGTVLKKSAGSNGNGDGNAQCLLPLDLDAKPETESGEIPQAREQAATPDAQKPAAITSPATEITDQLFLDTVRNRVYQKLAAGEIELGIGDGFKAIEIKHKLSEESQNERLLLELLNEIRAEELGKSK